jgi:hypothetical protein
VRPALVAVGVVFVAVAVVSVASVMIVPPAPQDQVLSTQVPALESGPNQTRQVLLDGTNTSDGSFDLSWKSTGPVLVELYGASGCGSGGVGCAGSPALAHWPRNASGTWTASGQLLYPYLLVWVDVGSSGISFQATGISHAISRPALPMLTLVLSEASAAALAIVGAVSIFLGLFLRSGVYRTRPPPDLTPAEDSATSGAGAPGDPVTGPRTGPSADGSGPPRPGPPARGR